jgi:hypothetical protein
MNKVRRLEIYLEARERAKNMSTEEIIDQFVRFQEAIAKLQDHADELEEQIEKLLSGKIEMP